jgi:hypothetical protein
MYAAGGSTYMRSRQYTFGDGSMPPSRARVRLRVSDGTTTSYSSYHSGGSAWEYLTVTFTVASDATAVNVGLAVDTGDTSGYIDGAQVVEGSSASGFQPRVHLFNQFPRTAILFASQIVKVTGSWTLTLVPDTSQILGFVYRQDSAANANNGDSYDIGVWLAAGTYTMTILGSTTNNMGKLEWYVDGELNAAAQDWYSAALTANVIKTGTLTVLGDGYHVLTGKTNGKNASSSDYLFRWTALYIVPLLGE